MGLMKEFKEFAMRGNVMDLAIGVILGAAFGLIVSSLVNDVIMPPIGLATGNLDFSQQRIVLKAGPDAAKIDAATGAPAGEVSIRYGKFLNAVINFVIVAFVIFMVVKGMNSMHRKEAVAPTPAAPTKDQVLLAEIRDALLRGRA
jgi:large conductance mechanosensitive channel